MVLGPWSSFPKGNCRDTCWKIGVNLGSSTGRGGKHSLLGPKSLSISYPHTILPMLHSLNASKSLFRGGFESNF